MIQSPVKIQIETKDHRGEWRIFLACDDQKKGPLDQPLRPLPRHGDSATYRRWHIPDDQVSYPRLKALAFDLEIVLMPARQSNEQVSATTILTTDTTERISSQGDNDGISEGILSTTSVVSTPYPADNTDQVTLKEIVSEQAVDSSHDPCETTDIPKESRAVHAETYYHANRIAQELVIKKPHHADQTEHVKKLKRTGWHQQSGVWKMSVLPKKAVLSNASCNSCCDRHITSSNTKGRPRSRDPSDADNPCIGKPCADGGSLKRFQLLKTSKFHPYVKQSLYTMQNIIRQCDYLTKSATVLQGCSVYK